MDELIAVWNAWLLAAQAINDQDEYSHDVFVSERRRRELLKEYGRD